MKKFPKLFITDIDGVWTDGGMYYDQTGNELKKFNTSDSAGVLFLKYLKTPFAIITSENTEIVKRRAAKLNVEHLFQGVKDKVGKAAELCSMLNCDLKEIAFIGDDLNDLTIMAKVGVVACPSNAVKEVKQVADFIMESKGGEGCVREFAELILSHQNV